MQFVNDLFRALLGISVLLGVCYLLSANRRAINWKTVGIGMGMQFVLATLILLVPGVNIVFDYVAQGFRKTLEFTAAGSQFLFGDLVTRMDSFGYIFAFQVLPTIVFFSALSSILYYLGILQKVVYGLAWLLSKAMGLSGPESLAAAANVFIGQTEAPLVIKPYLEGMTKSELLCVMVGGMATIAGSVFVAYVGFLGGDDPVQQQFFAKHLLTASIISAPAAIVAAKMLYPTEITPEITAEVRTEIPTERLDNRTLDSTVAPDALDRPGSRINDLEMAADESNNLLDAISRGTTDGLKLAVNVGAMLLVFTALIFMLNFLFLEGTAIINYLANLVTDAGDWNQAIADSTAGRFEGFSFSYLLALLFAPVAWILGVPAQDITLIGELLGLKTVINEFVAYDAFQQLRAGGSQLTPKSTLIAAYALCGFANFASIGIQIGGIGAIAPGQRKHLTELGIMSLVGGTVACLLTGAVAGVFWQFS